MKTRLSFLIIISLLLFLTCSPQSSQIQLNSDNTSDIDIIQIDNPTNTASGDLQITISENTEKDFNLSEKISKTTLPDLDLERDTFRVTATCTNGSGFRLNTKLTSIQIQGVPVGSWRIQIESIHKDDISIAYG